MNSQQPLSSTWKVLASHQLLPICQKDEPLGRVCQFTLSLGSRIEGLVGPFTVLLFQSLGFGWKSPSSLQAATRARYWQMLGLQTPLHLLRIYVSCSPNKIIFFIIRVLTNESIFRELLLSKQKQRIYYAEHNFKFPATPLQSSHHREASLIGNSVATAVLIPNANPKNGAQVS